MSLLSLLNRNKRHAVLCNITDHVMQVARLGQIDQRPLLVDGFAELPLGDDEALNRWMREHFAGRPTGYMPGYCGFYPFERVLIRESVNTRRLKEPRYLELLLAESAKLSGLRDWQIGAVHPVDGQEFDGNTPSGPALLFGLPRAVAREAQQRLCKFGLLPRRLELGSLTLLGALSRHLRESNYAKAVVACEIERTQTRIYFVGKDGVHTPPPLPHGLRSIEEAAMKELSAPDVGSAHQQLTRASDELRGHGRRLVRPLTRHLKPAVDYFEMKTGQPIGALFSAHLPESLGWLEEALSAAVELEFLVPDFVMGLSSVGIELGPDTPPPHRGWFQALSLVGNLDVSYVHEAKP